MGMSDDLSFHGFRIIVVVVSFLSIVDGFHQHRVVIDS